MQADQPFNEYSKNIQADALFYSTVVGVLPHVFPSPFEPLFQTAKKGMLAIHGT